MTGHPPETIHLQALALEALENVSDAFVALDADWCIRYANKEACRLSQKPLKELVGRLCWDEWSGAAGTEMERQMRAALEQQIPLHFEYHHVALPFDVWLNVNVYPIPSGGLSLFCQDITNRKAAEDRLRQFQFLSDNAADAFFLLDEGGRFVYVNAAACQSLGYAAEQFAHLLAVDIDPTYDDVQFRALFLRAEGERLPPFESQQRRADGSLLPIEASVSRLNVGTRALLLSCCRNITERKRAALEASQSAAHQWIFLRDVLASVSEGHLRLCQTAQDLPPLLMPFGPPVALSRQGGMAPLRAQTLAACRTAGISEARAYDLATAASEAAMNAAVHVGQGIGQVFADANAGHVQVRVEDQGSGIALEDLPHATLKKGYTTAGTLGHGMKMMFQIADRLFLLTDSDGTIVILELDRVVAPTFL